jgi:hypothetical protein
VPYWRRHWIVQEVCLARDRLLLYGNLQLRWEDLKIWIIDYRSDQYWDLPIASQSDGAFRRLFSAQISTDFTAKGVSIGPTNIPWEFTTRIAAHSKCANPRDKIYGSKALMGENFDIPMDYTKPVKDVFLMAIERACPKTLKQGLYTLAYGMVDPVIGMRLNDTKDDIPSLRVNVRNAVVDLFDEKEECGQEIEWWELKALFAHHLLSADSTQADDTQAAWE